MKEFGIFFCLFVCMASVVYVQKMYGKQITKEISEIYQGLVSTPSSGPDVVASGQSQKE